jgi:riboflavin synthase
VFTGLVGAVGTVLSNRRAGGVWEISIEAPHGFLSEVRPGDSVAVCGVCLTAVKVGGGAFSAQMMEETVGRTKLGALRGGSKVNLELAMRINGRLDGHLVQGHVDCVGTVSRWEMGGESPKLWISIPRDFAPLVVPKGSVAIDGVSLTVIDALEEAFSVGLIPETLMRTSLGGLRVGDPVNLEGDIIGKYVLRLLGTVFNGDSSERSLGRGGITLEMLGRHGWDVGGRY